MKNSLLILPISISTSNSYRNPHTVPLLRSTSGTTRTSTVSESLFFQVIQFTTEGKTDTTPGVRILLSVPWSPDWILLLFTPGFYLFIFSGSVFFHYDILTYVSRNLFYIVPARIYCGPLRLWIPHLSLFFLRLSSDFLNVLLSTVGTPFSWWFWVRTRVSYVSQIVSGEGVIGG